MTDLSEFRQEFGELKGKFESLEKSCDKLSKQVEALTAVLNQARGAKYVIFLVPAIIGAVASALAFFGLRMTFGGH